MVATDRELESCLTQLGNMDPSRSGALDSAGISLVNWNIQKGHNPDWIADLATFSDNPHLMVFQEAALDAEAWNTVGNEHYRSFAPGYKTSRSLTGLMTLSTVEPLAQCNLVSVEPWLRSPKATLVTEYALTDTDKTLLVVNIHAINFTFGTRRFKEQVNIALAVVDDHDGPVLMSGDFNTWHWRQSAVLQEMTEERGFEVLSFDNDHRTRAFGQVLDYIFVRDLQVLDSSTADYSSSDHNPMYVRFSL
jgi:endonuclease/exonuclease/phosphatase (EEP) superfamily protein YafD